MYQKGNQNPKSEERETMQWSNEKGQSDNQQSMIRDANN